MSEQAVCAVADEFNFDLAENRFGPFPIIHRDKSKRWYILKEATGEDARVYRNTITSGTRFTKSGDPSHVEGIADAEPLLVSRCLFRVTIDEGIESEMLRLGNFTVADEPVPLAEIKTWPSRVLQPIYRKIREISGMKRDDEEAIKDKESAAKK